MSITDELHCHLLPLTDIKWGPHLGYGYFSGGSSEIQKDFLTPDFYLNCFFLCSFLLFNKRILLLTLLTQTWQFRVLFLVVEELYLSKTLYLRMKASQLAALTGGLGRNKQHPASPLGTWRRNTDLCFAAILNSLKTNCGIKIFCYKPIPNNAEFIFTEKILGKKCTLLFPKKKSLLFIK